MQNYSQPGDVVTFTAPSGGVVSGTPVQIGQVLAIPTVSAAQTLPFAALIRGVIVGSKVSAQVWTEGAVIYWDNSAKLFTTVATSNISVGHAAAAAANPTATGSVNLHGIASPVGVWA